MPKFFNLSEDAQIVARFLFAIVLALWSIASFVVIVALVWRDWQVASFFDRWFGSWTDLQLTLLAAGMFLTTVFGLKWLRDTLRPQGERG
ncbi:hypothetical protein [Paraburkholderia youngii]|uniref:hypothetical protein n=1 Tax=Paraburkholderia youngii TaxID=2782701 RepID=UPI003D196439